MARILITNDDGVDAEGLLAARDALTGLGEVVVVAPSSQRSASSHAVTLRQPLHVREPAPGLHAVDGTPVDCVFVACEVVLGGQRPDLLVSGINAGGNLGDDILYSGTVAAAVEGALRNIPSIAVSLVATHGHDYQDTARFLASLARQVLQHGLAARTLLNVNVPKRLTPPPRYRLTRVGQHGYRDVIEHLGHGPQGRRLQIGGSWAGYQELDGSDCVAVGQGMVSVTALRPLLCTAEAPLLQRGQALDGFAAA